MGVLLAQSFDRILLEEVGKAVAEELLEFHVSWWLAPGMNIQRNPLCGRNFEYYSEDPYVSGAMAAAITKGVQSQPGVGTIVKHLACNNQEDNRIGSDSIVSERALREIYLRGFEIAVKGSQPMCIMTSYNLINGVHGANCYDTCTVAAREEWGFRGVIMSDWTTTLPEAGGIPHLCVKAGNDLIMPGMQSDYDEILDAYGSGQLSEDEIRACAARLISIIWRTSAYENAVPYGGQRFDPAYLHQSKIIRTTSSQSEMGSDFALSSMISNPAANMVSVSQNNDMEEIIMRTLLSCKFNIDTACVELKYSDGSMLAIDCDGVEDEYAKAIRQRSALDYLVYNAPLEYAELILCGDAEGYLKNSGDILQDE